MILTPQFIIDIMEQIEREVELSDCPIWKDLENSDLLWPKRWETLKQRIENLKVLR